MPYLPKKWETGKDVSFIDDYRTAKSKERVTSVIIDVLNDIRYCFESIEPLE